MTIEEFVKSKGYPSYIKLGEMNGITVYRMTFPGWEDACVGLPRFVIPTDDGFQTIDKEKQTFEIMDYFYK